MIDRLAIGKTTERQAESWLRRAGLKSVTRNYRCRGGEIDLVMQDDDILVFVEVRYRRDARFGGPIASIDARKQRRLCVAAAHYLQANQWDGPCRFDVIGLQGDGQAPEWIRDAFGA